MNSNKVRNVMFVLFGILLSLGFTMEAQAQQLYFNDFDGGETFADGVTGGITGFGDIVSVGGFDGYADPVYTLNSFGGNFLWNTELGIDPNATDPNAALNNKTVLTLNGLPAHTEIYVNFLLGLIGSWDGSDQGGEKFNCSVRDSAGEVGYWGGQFHQISRTDGAICVDNVAANVEISWGVHLFGGVEDETAYAPGNDPVLDAIPHTDSTLIIEFYASGPGYQGTANENWAIENIEVLLSQPPPCLELPIADLNQDCYVNMLDFLILANNWLDCKVLGDPTCVIPTLTVSSAAGSGGAGSLSWMHQICDGENRILVVGATLEEAVDPTQMDVTGVTYDGVAMTEVAGLAMDPNNVVGTTTLMGSELWYMLESNLPVAGILAQVVVTYETSGGSGPDMQTGGAVSMAGLAQQAPEAIAKNGHDGGDNNVSADITTLTNGAVLFDVFGVGDTGTSTPTTVGMELMYDVNSDSSSGAGSIMTVPTAGLVTVGYSHTNANRKSLSIAAFATAP